MRAVVATRKHRGTTGRRHAVFAAILVATVALVAADPTALCLLPALALALPLLLHRYPGERVISALSTAPRRTWERPRASRPRTKGPAALVPRGTLLLARSLAVRPPPLASPGR